MYLSKFPCYAQEKFKVELIPTPGKERNNVNVMVYSQFITCCEGKGVEYPLVLVIYSSTLHFLPCNITHQSVPVKVQ